MNLREYLTEEKIPTTKKFGFKMDNPGGEWLKYERERAKKGGWGSVTGYFREEFMIPTKMVYGLKGKQGEVRKLSDARVKELKKEIESFGQIYNPIFINVEYDGEALINEGNRRTLIAHILGWKYIPVEIKYYAGGERVEGKFHPDNIAKVAKKWNKPKKPEMRAPLPKSKPFKKEPFKKSQKKDDPHTGLDKETIEILKYLKL